mgnify:CR=1 FL=1
MPGASAARPERKPIRWRWCLIPRCAGWVRTAPISGSPPPTSATPRERLAEIPEDCQKAYCELVGTDSFAISETLRKRVGFALFNIMDVARAPLKKLDLIYCQNVLIYFARDRRKQLLSALADLLKPGGMLVLGAGEVIGFTHPLLTRIGNRQTLAFRRSG